MSVATATVTTAASKPSAIATLFPGYFALVMATGIVSIAAHFLGMEPIAQGLLWFNVMAYVVFFTESVAAICLAIGLFTRIAAAMVGIQMLVITFVFQFMLMLVSL